MDILKVIIMKRFIFVLLAMCSFTFSYSQKLYAVEDYLTTEEKKYTENDLDNAFAAPLSKFVGKKWYQSWYNDEVRYVIFNNNKTGAIVLELTDNNYTYPIKGIIKLSKLLKKSVLVRHIVLNWDIISQLQYH